MELLPIKNKELFLKYAIPCGEVLVRRGEIEPEILENLRKSVECGDNIEIDVAEFFPVAARMTTILAKRMGKKEVDEEIIRRYFLLEHEKAIRWRMKIHPDVKIRDCMVYPGRVLKIYSDSVLVKTLLGEIFLRNDFNNNLKIKDWVSTHYDYVSEKINPNYANKMRNKILRSRKNE
jgi:hypothetical protein